MMCLSPSAGSLMSPADTTLFGPVSQIKCKCGSFFLAVGSSAGCLPISMPFLFLFAKRILILLWQVMGCIRRTRMEAVLFLRPPTGLGKGLWPGLGMALREDTCWGSILGKVLLLFFLKPPFLPLGGCQV